MYAFAKSAGSNRTCKKHFGTAALALAAAGAASAMPIAAQAQGSASAAQTVYQLDVQLDQANARCAATDARFAAAYQRFTASRGYVLASAEQELRIQLTQQMGSTAAQAEFARIRSAAMASGQPDCAAMTAAMGQLSSASGSAALIAVADQVVHGAPAMAVAMADR